MAIYSDTLPIVALEAILSSSMARRSFDDYLVVKLKCKENHSADEEKLDIELFHVFERIDSLLLTMSMPIFEGDEGSPLQSPDNSRVSFFLKSFKTMISLASSSFLYSPTGLILLSVMQHDNINELARSVRVLRSSALETLASKHFNLFINSKYYKEWRRRESRHAMAMSIPDAKLPGADGFSFYSESSRTSRTLESFKAKLSGKSFNFPSVMGPRAQRYMSPLSTKDSTPRGVGVAVLRRLHSDVSVQAFSDMDDLELRRVLTGENWLAALLAAAEELPVGLAVASAKASHAGFPILFVNKAFEQMTGYDRNELRGSNLSILQSSDPLHIKKNKPALRKLTSRLRRKRSCTVALKNVRKDGEDFTNLMSTKPILDEARRYCYVISIHYEITNEADVKRRTQLAESFIQKLPGVIFTEVSEY